MNKSNKFSPEVRELLRSISHLLGSCFFLILGVLLSGRHPGGPGQGLSLGVQVL